MDNSDIECSATYAEMVENGKQLAEDVANGKASMENELCWWSYIGCGWWSAWAKDIHVSSRETK